MKGVVLAGGKGTRLWPVTKVAGKHFLPVGDKPIIYYPILTLKKAGVKDILIVCGPEHTEQYVRLLGSGEEFGVNLYYTIQVEPVGIAHGLGLARSFSDGQKIALILGDNIFGDEFSKAFASFDKRDQGAAVVLKRVPDPKRFGVAKFKGHKVERIIEKPKRPPSSWAVTGLYLYDNRVFDVIKSLKPSARGEYEITDVNNRYINEGTMDFIKTKKFWIDAGTFESLHQANLLVRKNRNLR
ncbi:MAG: spore coat protein [Candidatus Yanofskybacteria bacterium RIFCSPHIGHO2_01_FULL_43_42]|uniref:glucose-1-phosphate thymidylyltransferase n=1 Tax=Candidatus Yanofskybacteria bacterium RIFCSPLOWO2_01_FULL_43_22 TaxID=1802695 RepID=A0A1F8GI60_9BACT|nr:MAG: spore coat protein [Candidatus Yanofskybacteria bacterium RIFCSPHIGHO2_01_FULL_43_42]OGN13314.1 MAG: spore coat protein [Candidatus Yanofskybacteria bacterium RIFCSPHIGHO2_02_FULL_43_17]OGN24730.1 MAG: spore coat protein [Candidatus Yanofskybacteria bacterium RIFCSPLOWO2_01_FULL_43_22]